jgi:hypothetical protein
MGWYWDGNGVFRKLANGQPWDHGWRFSPTRIPGIERDCKYQHMIFFAGIKDCGTVPRFCRYCWKVVVPLANLKQVLAIEEWQQNGEAAGWACKVGGDFRSYTQISWGAFFYCRGREAGLERLDQVRAWLDENLPGVRAFLKRGCTEFEAEIGDSAKWDDGDIVKAIKIEAEAEQFIDPGEVLMQQPAHLVPYVHEKWREWAGQTRVLRAYEREGGKDENEHS